MTEEDARALAEGVDIGEKDLTRPARLEILSTWESDTGSEENGKRLGIRDPPYHP